MFIVSGWTVVELPYVAFDKEASKFAPAGLCALTVDAPAYPCKIAENAPVYADSFRNAERNCKLPVILGSPASRLP